MTSMGLAPLTFTGISKFSEDFQTILKRAVSIANVPIQRLQNEQSDVLQKKLITVGLGDSLKAFQDKLQALSNIGDKKAIVGTSSNTSKVVITGTSASASATYTISEITSKASTASETSASGYTDGATSPVSTTGTVKLTVGSQEYEITLNAGENNLAGLRDKINGLNAGVTASVLTTGTGATPNYLSISANTSGATTLTLVDDPAGAASALLTANNQGSNAEFKLNGVQVSKKSNTINDVVAGVTFDIAGTTGAGESVTVTLSSDRGKLKSALKDLVGSYNALAKQLDTQIGANAGLLTGDHLLRDIQDAMRSVTGFKGSGSVKSIADLGFSLSTTGEISFDDATFDGLGDSEVQAGFAFVGPASGLGSLIHQFEQITDPVTGIIKVQQDQYDGTDKRLTSSISEQQTRVSNMQRTLSEKLQASDALLAKLESQQSVLDASLQSLTTLLYGKKE